MKRDKNIDRVLLTPDRIKSRVKQLAEQISRDFSTKNLAVISVLKGSVVFLADLLRCLKIPCSIDFMSLASYGNGARSSGNVRVMMDLRESPEGKDILVVEDILDTGLTMKYLLDNLSTRRPKSIKVCALLDRAENRKVNVKAHYVGFKIPNYFVVGYGLDFAEKYRNLPYVGILKREVYLSEK